MTVEWVIILAGIGTYLMRSAGVWLNPPAERITWLNHLPFAVILVMSVSSISGIADFGQTNWQQGIAAIAASLAVILASTRKLPLVVCILVGCVVFGAIAPH